MANSAKALGPGQIHTSNYLTWLFIAMERLFTKHMVAEALALAIGTEDSSNLTDSSLHSFFKINTYFQPIDFSGILKRCHN